MKLTLQTQLLPDPEAAAKLKATVEQFNEAATWLAGVAFARKLANKFLLQQLCYVELRERFGLPADMAIRCISQVCEAYKRDEKKKPKFRKHAAVPYSTRWARTSASRDRTASASARSADGWSSRSSWGSTRPISSAGPRGNPTWSFATTASGSCW
ncbi:MAG TPA: hypothetical protein VKA15_19050 [Isosphaeraceae bacterium]|nr:hypothetical protein [Isosphaeraceae bacterium]